jgi:L-ascorbate metabolism protein UlaG (beta-lactamase superfamily)
MKYKVGILGSLMSLIVACLLLAGYLHLPMFGSLPRGDRLLKLEKSPNYKNGRFHNVNETSRMAMRPFRAFKNFFFSKRVNVRPEHPLPTIKTDLENLDRSEDILIWFGHSSYLIQIDGKRILVDPFFSKTSSPVLFFPRPFEGADVYKAEDMPPLDYIIITHDHWDHLDHETMLKLKRKSVKIICGLGVGAHLERWGFAAEQIFEMDWNETHNFEIFFSVHCLPARHFSGRGILSNRSLWASFLIETSNFKIYIGGDSGYGPHYKEIGKKFPSIDLALLDSGQHNVNWRQVHMMIDEVMSAARDLRTKKLLPVHWGKISLSTHPWNEPPVEITKLSKGAPFSVLIPKIGEKVYLKATSQVFSKWWEN